MQDQMTDQGGNLSTGMIIGTAVAAGVIAFLVRRARHADEVRIESASDVAAFAWEKAKEADLKGRTASVTREFIMERLLPEMKPILLEVLDDVEGYVDQAFRRTEKAIKGF
ncbi:MAG: hypothetical protein QOF51_3917 [Chloroflexota bacterium]|nr:hypothetical protein [Chloroflexota bacterium]